MNAFQARREQCRRELVALLQTSLPLDLLCESVGNVGDSLIREGTQRLLADSGLPYSGVTTALESADCRERTLVIRGSGGFDRLFHAFLPNVVLRAASVYRRVVILPSSYDPREPVVARCLEQGNVHACARDLRSYHRIRDCGRAMAAMDCAVFHPRLMSPAVAADHAEHSQEMLLVLRGDRGSPLRQHGLVPNAELNDDISTTAAGVDAWLDRIAGAAVIVTDRLHVSLAAVLLGKRVVVVDPYDDKISGYMEFTLAGEYSDRIERQTVEWLVAEGLVQSARVA